MASLTQTAIIVRKVIRYGIYGIIALIVIRYSILVGVKAYNYFFPEPPPPPTITFGKLPEIQFPTKSSYEDLKLILETPEGGLPTFPPQMNIYFMPKLTSNIQSEERAKQKAASLGFNSNGRELSDTIYLFEHKSAPSHLNMNIVTNVFSISYDFSSNPAIINHPAPAPEIAIASAKSYVAKAGLLASDLSGPTDYEFLKVKDGKFSGTISLSESDFIKANIYRKAYEEYPSMTPNPKQANIWFIVGGGIRGRTQVIAGEYHYFPVDESESSTYPIMTANEAWEKLKTGNGYIANLGENKSDSQIKIRRVYLAYYDSGQYMEFFQPIYVFEGDNEFFAYVPAISSALYGTSESSE